ncbi:MAG: DUF4236 domain-containing protein [Roseiarcus sp.]|jgi:hypothetical protein
MGFRFYRRVRIIPGLRANISRSGISLSLGHKGLWYTVGSHGRRVTLSLPGSGLSWTQRLPAAAPPHAGPPGLYRIEPIPPAPPVHAGHRLAFIVVIVVLALLLLAGAHG